MALHTCIVDDKNELNVYFVNKDEVKSVLLSIGAPFTHEKDIYLDIDDVEWLIKQLTEMKELLID